MKTFILSFVLLGGVLFGQEPAAVYEFLDVPWGTNVEQTKKLFPKRSGARLDRFKSTDKELLFAGGKFAGFKVDNFRLGFVNDRFYKVDVRLEKKSEGHEAEFLALKKMLVQKYGDAEQPDPAGTRRTLDWHVKDQAAGKEVHLSVAADPAGTGAWIVYTCDRIQDVAAPVAAAKPSGQKGAKPAKITAEAKDDL